MFDVRGPLHGSLRTQIMPNQGAPGLCTGGELNIEFQSRAVDDASITASQTIVDNTAWRLTTAIKILPC